MLNVISFFFIFLFTNSPLHSMDKLSDDLIVYDIGGRLNRIAKCALSMSCKKHLQLISHQSTLNKNYTNACAVHDEKKAAEWRRKGGLYDHEEVYNLFTEDKDMLSILLLKNTNNFARECVGQVFLYGIKQHNKSFIEWLLIQNISISKNDYLQESITLAKELNNRDIIQLLERYVTPSPYWGSSCLGYCVE